MAKIDYSQLMIADLVMCRNSLLSILSTDSIAFDALGLHEDQNEPSHAVVHTNVHILHWALRDHDSFCKNICHGYCPNMLH
jgi:hypothetical protein